MPVSEPASKDRILCLRLSGLGDIVHTLNALSQLRTHRPAAHIVWVVEERFAGLLEGHPYIDELIRIPRSDWGQMLRNPLLYARLLPQLWDLARSLRLRRFDISIDFQSSVKTAWLVTAAWAPLRIGFARPVSRELNCMVQNSLVSVPIEGCHRVERYLALLAPLGIPARYMPAVLPRVEERPGAADSLLWETDGPLVVIHPGTSRFAAFKRWPAQRYAELADRLVRERDARVLVTWGRDERELAEVVAEGAHAKAAISPEPNDLKQLIRLLRRADLFVGSDTGPMHLASALEVPVVALFGPKDPAQTGPYCSRSEVVTADVECRPCNKRRCRDLHCMRGITVQQVFEAACRVIDGGGVLSAETRGLPSGVCPPSVWRGHHAWAKQP